ncbi:hypothetical protein JZ751_012400 [Albula glossodonta]|uniref:Uncharacterized protein n=1 Tax=Albula glossodonta TaxID=121402 RepID=A0A8T2PSI5_9TELE|nr:hypothetical protein JZ751_012400 [Albula glossodonta]
MHSCRTRPRTLHPQTPETPSHPSPHAFDNAVSAEIRALLSTYYNDRHIHPHNYPGVGDLLVSIVTITVITICEIFRNAADQRSQTQETLPHTDLPWRTSSALHRCCLVGGACWAQTLVVPSYEGTLLIDTSDDLGAVTDILKRHMQEFELRGQLSHPTHWTSVFDEAPNHQAAERSPRPECRAPRSPRCPRSAPRSSENDRPCSRRGRPEAQPRCRPRTLSLDAKLSSLQGRGYGDLQCQCQAPPSQASEAGLSRPSSASASTYSNSSSEGSTTPESDSAPFPPRSAPGRRSIGNLRAKLDPRTWLQTQV